MDFICNQIESNYGHSALSLHEKSGIMSRCKWRWTVSLLQSLD